MHRAQSLSVPHFICPPRDMILYNFLTSRGSFKTGALLPACVPRGPMGRCFENAWDAATRCGLDYWEGLAWEPGPDAIGYYHAWCVDRRSNCVIDPTWGADPERYYLGVHIPTPVVLRILTKSRTFGVLDKGRGFEARTVQKYWGWAKATVNAGGVSTSRRSIASTRS